MTEAPEKVYLATPERGGIDPFWYGEKPDKPSPLVQDVKYRRADLPPKVKELGKDITVKTLFGSYFIEDQNYEYVLFFIPPTAKKRSDWQMLGAGEYGDMVNERQAHYESLVLSCLETTQ